MVRLLSLGCFCVGSFVAIVGVFVGMSEAVISGCGLAAAGIGAKTLQKRYEGG